MDRKKIIGLDFSAHSYKRTLSPSCQEPERKKKELPDESYSDENSLDFLIRTHDELKQTKHYLLNEGISPRVIPSLNSIDTIRLRILTNLPNFFMGHTSPESIQNHQSDMSKAKQELVKLLSLTKESHGSTLNNYIRLAARFLKEIEAQFQFPKDTSSPMLEEESSEQIYLPIQSLEIVDTYTLVSHLENPHLISQRSTVGSDGVFFLMPPVGGKPIVLKYSYDITSELLGNYCTEMMGIRHPKINVIPKDILSEYQHNLPPSDVETDYVVTMPYVQGFDISSVNARRAQDILHLPSTIFFDIGKIMVLDLLTANIDRFPFPLLATSTNSLCVGNAGNIMVTATNPPEIIAIDQVIGLKFIEEKEHSPQAITTAIQKTLADLLKHPSESYTLQALIGFLSDVYVVQERDIENLKKGIIHSLEILSHTEFNRDTFDKMGMPQTDTHYIDRATQFITTNKWTLLSEWRRVCK